MPDFDRTLTSFDMQDEPACDPRKSHMQNTNANPFAKVQEALVNAFAPQTVLA